MPKPPSDPRAQAPRNVRGTPEYRIGWKAVRAPASCAFVNKSEIARRSGIDRFRVRNIFDGYTIPTDGEIFALGAALLAMPLPDRSHARTPPPRRINWRSSSDDDESDDNAPAPPSNSTASRRSIPKTTRGASAPVPHADPRPVKVARASGYIRKSIAGDNDA